MLRIYILLVCIIFLTGCSNEETRKEYDYVRYFDNKVEFTLNNTSENTSENSFENNSSSDESNTAVDEQLNLYSKSAVIIDATDGHILYSKNSSEKLAMASTTKIMTAIIALENCSSSEVVTVSEKAASAPKVKLGLKAGEQYYLGDLLYSMMLESHNDSAVAIAEHIGGSVEGFSLMMNNKAYELGLSDSSFVTPNGLDAEGHYSTAYDMALLGAYAIQNEEFRNLVNTVSHSFSEINNKSYHSVNNINAYLSMDETAIGIKTGFTNEAGYCFVGANEVNGRILVSCILACGWPNNKGYKWADMNKLVDYAIENCTVSELHVLENEYTGDLEINGYSLYLKSKEYVDVITEIHSEGQIKNYIIYGNLWRSLE